MVSRRCRTQLRTAEGERKEVLRRRARAADARIRYLTAFLKEQARRAAVAAADRERRQRHAEEAPLWQAFRRLRIHPTAVNAQAAKRAFLTLAKRHHPDQGGTHEDFLRLKEAYDLATGRVRMLHGSDRA